MLLIAIFAVIFIHSACSQTAQYSQIYGECLTPRSERSVCVSLMECGDLYNILTKVPLNENDKIYLRRSQCGYAQNSVLVCCPPQSVPRVSTSQPFTSTNRNPPVDQGPPFTDNRNGVVELPQPGVCGTGSTNRIYGGNLTKIDEFPWMVLLEYYKPNNRRGFHCGGSLISSRYVLTASHCVNGRAIPADWRLSSVRLGEWDTGTENDCDEADCSDPPQDVAIERAITHEQYDPNSRGQYNDIALLRLVRPVAFTDWIKPVCLPTASELRDTSFEGITLEVAGWGKTEGGVASRYKLKAQVDGVPLSNCNRVYARQSVQLLSSQMCAGGKVGVDSCSGDSGGPLIGYNTANRGRPYFFLAGVVSFGPNPCALQDWPGVYTRVGHYIDWIKSHMSP